MAFCETCPVPKVIAEIEAGTSEFCKKGLLSDEDARQATAALLRAIGKQGECMEGAPDVSAYDEENDWHRCLHQYNLEISGVGDGLETDSAGIVLDGRTEKVTTRG